MPLAVNGYKVCSNPNCPHQGQPQPIKNFSNHKRYGDGKQPQCKTCMNLANVKYRQTEAGKSSALKYYYSEKGQKKYKEYSQSDKAKEASRQYYLAHRPPLKEQKPREKIQVIEKVCIYPDCPHQGQSQPAKNFYKSNRSIDGLAAWCKECKKRWQQEYKESGRDRLVKQRYKDSPRGIENRKRYNQLEQVKQAIREKSKRIRQDPVLGKRVLARNRLNKAIRAGRIPHVTTQVCILCGKPARQYHHYLGYEEAHWYDVQPMCPKCHKKADKELA